ncbi:MAG: imidazoleglycerol-phosphate dehydratase HisB [Acutalibacteraceae bacterium]|nr:imidazoleglycerol-phosphate dehydratase HisB [Acutalibacteraceae bacterium]
MREAHIKRKTNETDIEMTLSLDGTGKNEIDTGCGFLDHMLELFARHGRMDLTVKCVGDTHVDYHHTVEDVGIVLGQAFAEAVGEKRGISRYGSILLPMDETLILASIDISGRAYLNYDVQIPTPAVGGMDTELVEEFFISFVRNSDITLHIKQLEGKNSHHIIEGIFKAFGRALCKAVFEDKTLGGEIPSTKGIL